jgi:hypothetical protein
VSAIFEPDGAGLLVPTGHATSPWAPDQLHGGGPAALVVRAVEALPTPVPMQLVRLTLEFLGTVPAAPLSIEAELVRGGKRLAQAEATVVGGGRPVIRARAALLRTGSVEVPDTSDGREPVPGPEAAAERPGFGAGEAFHRTGNEIRFVRGSFLEPGPALAWFRLAHPVVAGEPVSPAMRACAAADFGNGISRVLEWESHLFINCDLSVGLHRLPEGEWIGVEARTDLDPAGVGQATSVLHDRRGPFGFGAQSLFVDARAPA